MRILSVLMVTAAAVTAQSPLTTTFANNNGGAVGGAMYYDLAAGGGDVVVTDIDFHFGDAAGTAGTLDFYTTAGTSVGVETTAASWTLFESVPVTAAGVGTPTNGAFTTPLVITAGSSIGVAIVANGLAHAYTTGTTPFPLVYEACPLTLTANAASNVPFTGGLFVPRVPNTNINFMAGGSCATVESQGDGCTTAFASFYEIMDSASMDLGGQIVTGLSQGGAPNTGYVVTAGAGPGGIAPGAGAVSLALGDDAQVATGTLGLSVGSNCWVANGAGNSNAFAPVLATFLGEPSDEVQAWTDLEPNATGSGLVWYEEVGTTAIVTYDGVFGWGTTDPNTVQITWDTATGNFTIEFGTLGTANPEVWLIGYSPAGTSADPGASDISAASVTPILTDSGDVLPLTLEAIGRPVVDPAMAVNFDVTTTNIDAGAIFHLGIVGLSRPGVPLSLVGFGSGDCFQWASLDVTVGPAIVAGGGGAPVTWTALTLPAGAATGLEFNAQGATLDLGILSPGGRTSNGLKCVVGDQ